MTRHSLGNTLRATLRPDEVHSTEPVYTGPRWPGLVGAFAGAFLMLGAILVLVLSTSQPVLRDPLIALMFTAFQVAGSMLTVAWAAAFQRGFGNVPVIIGSVAVACCFGYLLNHQLPSLPDPLVIEMIEARQASLAELHRATKLRGFLIIAPFVLFFGGLVSYRGLGWLRAVAALGCASAFFLSVKPIATSRTMDGFFGYTFIGSVFLAGIWLLVVFVGLAQSARTRAEQIATNSAGKPG